MSSEPASSIRPPAPPGLAEVWRQLPDRSVLLILLAAWVVVFQLFGNSTLGYANTRSLFGWWYWMETRGSVDEAGRLVFNKLLNSDELHAWLMPGVVLGLLWVRREDLLALPKRIWWPGLAALAAGFALHFVGFLVQQPRISVLGFFAGLYGMTGLVWGWPWMRAVMFPFALLVFCVPLGVAAEPLTVPLRLLATKLTAMFCDGVLGIKVMYEGNRLFNAARTYTYEVAQVCSGMKSLITIVAFGVIYAYLNFKSFWRRLAIVASAVPLAVAANVCRLSMIVIAAEAFSPQAGNYVHDSGTLSLLPYIPAFGGMMLLGWWLRENRKPKSARVSNAPVLLAGAGQEP